MAVTKVLARGWKLEVEDPTMTGTWIQVKGLKTFTFSESKEDADTTDFDSGGWAEHMVAQRAKEIGVEAHYLEDKQTGDRDPGQEAVEVYAAKVGEDSLGKFRITSPGGTARTFYASAVVGERGGGINDPSNWNCTLTISGPEQPDV